jgi:PAS domain S-box-containing protein
MPGLSISELPTCLAQLLEGQDALCNLELALGQLSKFGIQTSSVDAAEPWLVLDAGAGPQRFWAPLPSGQVERSALDVAKSQLQLAARLARECERHRRTEERLEMLSAASFEGIMIHVDGVIIDCNQRLAEMLRCDYSEVIGAQTMRLCVAPEDYPTVLDRLTHRLEGEYVISGIRKDGSRFRAEIHAKQGRIGERPVRVAAVRDVTERERVWALLKESEQRLRDLAEAAFDFVVSSKEGVICAASGRCFDVLGFTPEQMIGRTLVQMAAPSSQPRVRQVLADDRLGVYEVTARDAQGQMVPLEIFATKATRDGEPVRVAGVRDLRKARRLENERRTLELQVERSQRLNSLGVLAGGIAHDFNNLLVGVMGNAELLLDVVKTPDAIDAAQAVVEAGRRAAQLVTQMLAYAGKGRAEQRVLVDLGELLGELRRLLEATLSKKANVEIVTRGPARVRGSRAQLTQVFMNLLTNASDSLEGKPGTIRVCVGPAERVDARWEKALGGHPPTGDRVLIEVSDCGEGMDQATLERAFEPFFTTKHSGHGLGLAACLGIVSSHEGAILVESELGRGTTFSVLLPASEQVSLQPKAQVAPGLGAGRRVLVVDDEQIVRSQLRRSLELRGYQVREAASGSAALDVLQDYTPDLVVLDMTMRDMDGAEALQRIRQRGIDVPVVLASGYMDQELERKLESSAFQGFLRKPYAIAELLDTVQGALAATG